MRERTPIRSVEIYGDADGDGQEEALFQGYPSMAGTPGGDLFGNCEARAKWGTCRIADRAGTQHIQRPEILGRASRGTRVRHPNRPILLKSIWSTKGTNAKRAPRAAKGTFSFVGMDMSSSSMTSLTSRRIRPGIEIGANLETSCTISPSPH